MSSFFFLIAACFSLVHSYRPIVKIGNLEGKIFPFEAADHYVPDNNSNNVINKHAINPPPSDAENRQGFCLRQFKGRMFCCFLAFEFLKY